MIDPRENPPARHGFVPAPADHHSGGFATNRAPIPSDLRNPDIPALYAVCGRLYPRIPPRRDQEYGGRIAANPASIMAGLAFLPTLNTLRQAEDRPRPDDMTEAERAMAELSRRWTER